MSPEYAKDLQSAVRIYEESTLPLIREGAYGAAAMEIGNALQILAEGMRNIPSGQQYRRLRRTVLSTAGRLEGLKKSCWFEDTSGIEIGLRFVEERIYLLGISADALAQNEQPEEERKNER